MNLLLRPFRFATPRAHPAGRAIFACALLASLIGPATGSIGEAATRGLEPSGEAPSDSAPPERAGQPENSGSDWLGSESWPLPETRRWLDRPAEPIDLADDGERIFVADTANGAVRVFDSEGREAGAWFLEGLESCAAAPLAIAASVGGAEVFVLWSYLPRDPRLPETRLVERRDARGEVLERVERDLTDLVIEPATGALIGVERDARASHLVYRESLTSEPRWRVSPGRPDARAGSLAINDGVIALLEAGGRRVLRYRAVDGRPEPAIALATSRALAVEAEAGGGWSVLVSDPSPLPSERKLLLRFDALGRPLDPLLAEDLGVPPIPRVDWNFSVSLQGERVSVISGDEHFELWSGSRSDAVLSMRLRGHSLRSGGVRLTCPDPEAERLGLEIWEDPQRFGTQVEVLDGLHAQLLRLDPGNDMLRPSLPLDPENPVLHFLRTESGALVLLTANRIEKRSAGDDRSIDWALGCLCNGVTDIASAKGELFVALPAQRSIQVLDLNNGAELRRWHAPPDAGHWPASLASDGKRVWASDSVRGRIHPWPATTAAWPGGAHAIVESLEWGMLPSKEPGLVLGLSDGDIAYHAAQDGRLFLRAPRPVSLVGLPNGSIPTGMDRQGRLITVDPESRTLRRHVAVAPEGAWTAAPSAPAATLPKDSCRLRFEQDLEPNPIERMDTTRLVLSIAERCPDTLQPGRDIVLVVDGSRSMFGDALEAVKASLAVFVDALPAKDFRIALISYDDDARVHAELNTDRARVVSALDAIQAEGQTDLAAGLELAAQVLRARQDQPARPAVVVVLTDGQQAFDPDPLPSARELEDFGAELYTVLLSEDREDPLLHEISRGWLLRAASHGSLPPIMSWLAARMDVRSIGRVELRQALSLELEPLEDRFVPDQFRESDATYRWGGSTLPSAGVTLTLEVAALRSGLLPVHQRLQLRFRDYLGQSHLISPAIEVLRVLDQPSPTPPPTWTPAATRAPARAWLPYVLMGLSCEARRSIDVALVIDRSTSMLEPLEGGDKLLALRSAALASVALAGNAADRHALVVADPMPFVAVPLTSDGPRLHAEIEALAADAQPGGSRLDLAFHAAAESLAPSTHSRPAILILTDGRIPVATESALRESAARARARGIDVLVLGFGDEINAHVFRRIAGAAERFARVDRVDAAASSAQDLIAGWRCP